MPPEGRKPAFVRDFPRTPELDALVDAFEQGNYARVRREAPELAARAEDPEVKKAALELRSRTAADPLALVLFGLAALVVAVLSLWWLVHGREHVN